jgi:alpha-amylase/alpha-mannosidase (GH57 family)
VEKEGFGYTVLDGSAVKQGRGEPLKLDGGLILIPRDNEISNAFSFSWPMQKKEVMERELTAMLNTRLREGRRWVVIALDGENWMNGEDHLGALYSVLASTHGVTSATLGESLKEVEAVSVDSVQDTSWALDHSFSTWEGSRAKDQQWSLIDEARDALRGSDGSAQAERARGYLRIAEGSDYTYWDFDRPGALARFGMSYATAARDIALSRSSASSHD